MNERVIGPPSGICRGLITRNTLKIRSPIWSERAIGIAQRRFKSTGSVLVEIIYVDKDGNQPYPHVYRAKASEAMRREATKGLVLLIFPIAQLQVVQSRGEI